METRTHSNRWVLDLPLAGVGTGHCTSNAPSIAIPVANRARGEGAQGLGEDSKRGPVRQLSRQPAVRTAGHHSSAADERCVSCEENGRAGRPLRSSRNRRGVQSMPRHKAWSARKGEASNWHSRIGRNSTQATNHPSKLHRVRIRLEARQPDCGGERHCDRNLSFRP